MLPSQHLAKIKTTSLFTRELPKLEQTEAANYVHYYVVCWMNLDRINLSPLHLLPQQILWVQRSNKSETCSKKTLKLARDPWTVSDVDGLRMSGVPRDVRHKWNCWCEYYWMQLRDKWPLKWTLFSILFTRLLNQRHRFVSDEKRARIKKIKK